jgi:predicted RNA polymerase sigma factor
VADRLLELEPNDERLWTLKADTLYRLSRYREAVNAADNALQINREYQPAKRIHEKAVKLMYQKKKI